MKFRATPRVLLIGLFVFVATASRAQEETPVIKGLRVATCGHSFHVFTYAGVAQIATSAGLDHRLAGISSIGGSTVQKHWDVAEENSKVKQALKAGGADVLTLSPIWLPDDAIEKFVQLALEHNPATRVLVQEYWMPNDEYVPVYPLQTKKKVDHNATDLAALREATRRYARDIEDYVKEINGRLGSRAVHVVPVGEAAVTLREKIMEGEVPGIARQSDLFRDSWGHALPPLQVLSSYCHFAVMYRRNPEGLPVPKALAVAEGISDDDKSLLNSLLQKIAWETVSVHPMTGLVP
ncbi:MAG: hypothetical protein ABL994_01365 [Verrucomicrobiales bacterium]